VFKPLNLSLFIKTCFLSQLCDNQLLNDVLRLIIYKRLKFHEKFHIYLHVNNLIDDDLKYVMKKLKNFGMDMKIKVCI
jgi:hypothetical protein